MSVVLPVNSTSFAIYRVAIAAAGHVCLLLWPTLTTVDAPSMEHRLLQSITWAFSCSLFLFSILGSAPAQKVCPLDPGWAQRGHHCRGHWSPIKHRSLAGRPGRSSAPDDVGD